MTATTKHKIIRASFITFVFILFALTFWPFFTELLLAALFAFAFHDFTEKILVKKIKRIYASLAVTLGVLVFIAAPLIWVSLKTITAVKEYMKVGLNNTPLYQTTEKLLRDASSYLISLAERFELDLTKLPDPTEILSHFSGDIGSFVTKFATQIPNMGLSTFIFFLALYYFLNESKKIKSQILKFDLLSESETNNIISVLKSSSYQTLAISLLIGGLQSLIVSVFAYFCGFPEFFMIFIVTFIFSLVPVVGSAPAPLFLMLISLMQGHTGIAIAMLVASIIAGSIDNFVKPIILSSSGKGDDLPAVLSLITLIGAILVYGAIGILIGPIITRLAANILDILSPDEKSGEITASTEP
ncbi:MAG: AI-2E family transporter [Bdellovibrionota bacterium]